MKKLLFIPLFLSIFTLTGCSNSIAPTFEGIKVQSTSDATTTGFDLLSTTSTLEIVTKDLQLNSTKYDYYGRVDDEIVISVMINNPDKVGLKSITINNVKYDYAFNSTEEGKFYKGSHSKRINILYTFEESDIYNFEVNEIVYDSGISGKKIDLSTEDYSNECTIAIRKTGTTPTVSTIQNITTTSESISCKITVNDSSEMVDKKYFYIINDANEVVKRVELTDNVSEITVEGLDADTSYTYVVVLVYDLYSSEGNIIKTYRESTFTTESI